MVLELLFVTNGRGAAPSISHKDPTSGSHSFGSFEIAREVQVGSESKEPQMHG